MTGLPVLPLIALGAVILAGPLVVLVLALVVVSLRFQVRRLEARVADLEARLAPASPAAAAPLATPAPPAADAAPPAAVDVGPAGAGLLPEARDVGVEPGALGPPAAGAAPPGTPAPPAGPGTRPPLGSWEGRVGGAWLSRAGALLLVLGAAFFLKHAFDRQWVGPGGRVALGLAAGVALVGGGLRLARREPYRAPAHSLVAVGIGILYLSLYAAHGFYALVSAPVALAAMAAVTAAGFTIAVRLDGRALAALAVLGGLLTPALLDPGGATAAPRLTYLAILDAGVLAVGRRRGWMGLVLLAWIGTHLLAAESAGSADAAERLRVALGWGSAFLLAFAGVAWMGPRVPGPGGAVSLSRAILILAAPAWYFAEVQRALGDAPGRRLGFLALGLAAAYGVATWLAARRGPAERRVVLLHGAVALGFLTVAPAAWLDRHDLTIAWAVEGLVLVWGGVRLGAGWLRAGGLAVQALAWGRWLVALGEDAGGPGAFLLAHPALPATVAIAGSAALGALAYRRREPSGPPLGPGERLVPPVLCLVAVGSLALLLASELDQFRTLAVVPAFVPAVKTVVWMLAGVALLALTRGDRTQLLLVAVSLLVIALAGETLAEAERWRRLPLALRPALWNPRFLAGCLLVVLVWLYGQVVGGLPYLGERARRWLGGAAGLAAAVLLLWNLSVEILLMPLPATRFEPAKLRSAALSILWAVYACAAMGWGLWRQRRALRVGAMLLFGATVLKVLAIDLADLDALYRILSVLVLGGALVLASLLYARARRPSETP
jgi:uncharacterized membrane protein